MGEVYRARDTKLGRDVAIKVLPSSIAAQPDRVARFEREARLLASVNHPHIGAIYGVEEAPGLVALVLELVDGETLAARIARKASAVSSRQSAGLPLAESLDIARQIAEALDAAHERGIVHRDLKPANVAITHEGIVKVLDFGLARDNSSADLNAESLTHSPTMMAATGQGVLLGTAPYMSPEQARGKAVDKRTDIWAFGCVLYEMLTGQRAFPGETATDTVAAIIERDPDWSQLPGTTPPAVVRLIRRCLEKDVRRRLRDIGDGRADLDNRDPLTTAPGIGSDRPARWRGSSFALGVVAAAAAFAVAGVVYSSGRTSAIGPPAFSRVVRLTRGPALKSSPQLSPDGKWVAYLSNARGPTDVWVTFLAGGDPINLTAGTTLTLQSQSDLGGIAVSPDGSLIAFDASDEGPGSVSVWVVPAPNGGTPRKLLRNARSARWSPDGTRLVALIAGGSSGDALIIADADGSNPRELSRKLGGMHKHWPAWSDDGRYIYFNYSISTSNAEPSELYRVPVGGGDIEPVVSTTRRAIFPVFLPGARGLVYAANPFGADLSLWWRPAAGGPAQRLTTGLGEYGQPSVSADGRMLVATVVEPRQSIVSLPVDSGDATAQLRELGDATTSDLDPSLSPDGRRIVFSSARSGNRNLWIAAADGTRPQPLTSGSAIDDRPAFSPDGKSIAFVSDRGGARGVWTVSADGGSVRLVGKAQVLDTISWSPDGSEIVFGTVGDQPGLSAIRVADGTTRRLESPAASIGAAGPAWSPNGEVAYIETFPASNGGLTTTRVAYIASRELAPPAAANLPTVGNGGVAWDRSGRRLAVYGNSGAVASVIFILERDGSRPPRKLIEFPPDVRLRGLTWSLDGSSLLVGRQRRTSDIALFELAR